MSKKKLINPIEGKNGEKAQKKTLSIDSKK